jgi:hypothetical protein
MSQTSCERCGFPVPMRWLHAGGHLSRPNSIHQCVDRALIPSGHPPKRLLHSADLPFRQTPMSNPVSVAPTIEVAGNIKST